MRRVGGAGDEREDGVVTQAGGDLDRQPTPEMSGEAVERLDHRVSRTAAR
jgi:hypothetical protein